MTHPQSAKESTFKGFKKKNQTITAERGQITILTIFIVPLT